MAPLRPPEDVEKIEDRSTPRDDTVVLEVEAESAAAIVRTSRASMNKETGAPLSMESFQFSLPDVARRMTHISWSFGRFASAMIWDWQTGKLDENMEKRAVSLRDTLFDLGPTFIKVGQAMSSRPDILPPPFLKEMTKLQDDVPPFPNEVAYNVIEEDLGRPCAEIFAEIGEQPVAAASLGQVYKGTLRTGEVVAIKLQRPGVAEKIALDVYVATQLAKVFSAMIKSIRPDLNLNLNGIVDEFAGRLFDELDYLAEASNAEHFQRLYGELPNVYVPAIFWDYTSKRVLTMEWVEGTKLTDLNAISAQGLEIRPLVETLIQCSIRQLLDQGFFHADPHPGNLLATPDGRLAYIDFGWVSDLKPYQKYGLLEAITHLVNRDFGKMGQLYVRLGFLDAETDLTPIIEALNEHMPAALNKSVGDLNFKVVIDELGDIMYQFPFSVPRFYASMIRCLGVLEGLALSADPNFHIIGTAYPFIASKLLTDDKMRSCLEELILYDDGKIRWRRLEDLVRQASRVPDLDLAGLANHTTEFLLSDAGGRYREVIAVELVDGVDAAVVTGQRAVMHVVSNPVEVARSAMASLAHHLENDTHLSLQQKLALVQSDLVATALATPPASTSSSFSLASNRWGGSSRRGPESSELSGLDKLQALQNIVEVVVNTDGVDRDLVVTLLGKIASRQETLEFGTAIAASLFDRIAARVIRAVFVPDADTRLSPSAPPSSSSSTISTAPS